MTDNPRTPKLQAAIDRLTRSGELHDELQFVISEATSAITADRDALRKGLAEAHREVGLVYEWGHRPGDHFDECPWCALIHGSGFAYPRKDTAK